jgi:hypothetical protein
MMSYYIARTIDGPFEKVIENVVERLKAQGFGVLTDIDVQGTLKSKIGATVPKFLELRSSITWPRETLLEPRQSNLGAGVAVELFFGERQRK